MQFNWTIFSQALNPNLSPLPSSDNLPLTPGRKSVMRQDTQMSTHLLGAGLPQSSLHGPLFILPQPAPPLSCLFPIHHNAIVTSLISGFPRPPKCGFMLLIQPYFSAVHAGQATFSQTVATCACSWALGCLSPPESLFYTLVFIAPAWGQSC